MGGKLHKREGRWLPVPQGFTKTRSYPHELHAKCMEDTVAFMIRTLRNLTWISQSSDSDDQKHHFSRVHLSRDLCRNLFPPQPSHVSHSSPGIRLYLPMRALHHYWHPLTRVCVTDSDATSFPTRLMVWSYNKHIKMGAILLHLLCDYFILHYYQIVTLQYISV